MRRSPALTVIAIVVTAALIAACSGDDSKESSSGSGTGSTTAVDFNNDPAAKAMLEGGAAMLEDPSFVAVVDSIEDEPGDLGTDGAAVLAKVRDGRVALAAGLRQIAGGQQPSSDAVDAANGIIDDPWLATQTVPGDPAAVSERLAALATSLRDPITNPSPDLDPERYVVVRNATVDEATPEVQTFAGKVDDLSKESRSSEDLAAARSALVALSIHPSADGSSGSSTTSTTSTTAKVGSAHRSARAAAQKDPKGCAKLRDEVNWDLFKLGLAIGAVAAGAAGTGGAALVAVGLGYGGFAAARHDLQRDSEAANDPDGPCGPADDRGDPHIRTYDHLRYSPQSVGEFVLSTTGTDGTIGTSGATDETIQVRQQPFGTSREISVVTGVAAKVAGTRVSIVSNETGATVTLDGVETPIDAEGTDLPNGGRVVAVESDDLRVVWPSGTILRALLQNQRMAVSVRLATSLAGTTTGLLGNADGNQDNDLVTRSGTPITSVSDRAQLYDQFLESWRITDAEALFTYEPGQSTATFTDKTFPDQGRTTADLSAEQRANAEKVCAAAGITEPTALEECLFDVGFSGDASFAYGLADSLGIISGSSTREQLQDGRTAGKISNPGDSIEYEFAATAGELRFFRADPSCAESRLAWRVVDSTGRTLSGNPYLCGDIGRVSFPKAGRYRVIVESYQGTTGDFAFSWETSKSSSGKLESGRTTGTISSAGQIDTYAFDVTAGEVRFFSHDDACTDSKLAWRLLDATDKQLSIFPYLCGDIGRYQFTAAGTYRVSVESYEGATGPYAFSWNAITDNSAALSTGRTAGTIAGKGQIDTYTFDAKAGDQRTFTADAGCADSQLAWRVLDATGRQLTSFPYLCDSIGAVPFTATGTYRLSVESYNGSTGSYAFTAS